MKKKIVKTAFVWFIVGLLTNLTIAHATYLGDFLGEGRFFVAFPSVRMETVPMQIDLMNTEKYCNQFKILNYDENEKITEVGLKYQLSIKTSLTNPPFDFKLYKLENGNEVEMELTNGLKTANEFVFLANEAQEHLFKLEVCHHASHEVLEKDIEIYVDLEAVQIEK